jgi:lipopolysaccharide export LptBFGC system permease protein LptF
MIFHFIPYILFGGFVAGLSTLINSNEMISFKIFGISHKRLLLPIISMATTCSIAIFLLTIISPISFQQFYISRNNYHSANLFSSIKEKTINNLGKNIMYIDKLDKNSIMHRVTIITKDPKKQKVIFITEAKIGYNQLNDMIIEGQNATVTITLDGKEKTIHFENIEILYSELFETNDSFSGFGGMAVNPKSQTNKKLLAYTMHSKEKNHNPYKTELLHRIYSIFLPIIMSFSCGIVLLKRYTKRYITIKDDLYLFTIFISLLLIKMIIIPALVNLEQIWLFFFICQIIIFIGAFKIYQLDKHILIDFKH